MNVMNEIILSDVAKVTGNINPLLVIVLLLVTTVGAVAMIALCSGGLAAMKKFLKRLFGKAED